MFAKGHTKRAVIIKITLTEITIVIAFFRFRFIIIVTIFIFLVINILTDIRSQDRLGAGVRFSVVVNTIATEVHNPNPIT